MRLATIVLAAAMAPAWGQTIKLPASIERLAAKAENSVEITMDKSMLRLASRFLSDHGDEAKARKVMGGLESIYVRSFTFSREGEYNAGGPGSHPGAISIARMVADCGSALEGRRRKCGRLTEAGG